MGKNLWHVITEVVVGSIGFLQSRFLDIRGERGLRPLIDPNLIPAWIDGVLVPVDRLHVHKAGLRHPAVAVFIIAEGQVVLQEQSMSSINSMGLWSSTVHTHPFWGESSAACAKRRLAEAMGITGVTLRQVGQVEYRANVGEGMSEHEVVDVFVGHAPTIANINFKLNPDPTEVARTGWISTGMISWRVWHDAEQFTPWLRVSMAEHWWMIFGKNAR